MFFNNLFLFIIIIILWKRTLKNLYFIYYLNNIFTFSLF